MEAIQMTNRDKSVWVYKNDEGTIITTPMVDMTDKHLQAALIICQKRKVRSFLGFQKDCSLEEQLLKTAKDRNLEVKNFEDEKETHLAAKYRELKEAMVSCINSIKRKAKSLQKV